MKKERDAGTVWVQVDPPSKGERVTWGLARVEPDLEEVRRGGACARYDGFKLKDNPYGRRELKEAWADGWRRWTDVVAPENA